MGEYQKVNGTKRSGLQSAAVKPAEPPVPAPRMKSSKNRGQISDTHVIIDAAVYYDDSGKATKTSGRNDPESDVHVQPPRLLVVSSRAKGVAMMTRALLPNIVMVQYKYETSSLDGILGLVAQALGTRKVECIALVFHYGQNQMYICAEGDKVLSSQTIIEQVSIREFFTTLVQNHLDCNWVNARLDFLTSPFADSIDAELISKEIETLLPAEIPVAFAIDLLGAGRLLQWIGTDNEAKQILIGELYFHTHLITTGSIRNRLQPSSAGYEKIRVVGKGAYGTAVLYRRKDDDSLVILKEINIHELNAQERQLALNEVAVLSKLEHPNIISYYDSFEEDGILMIEMEYADGGNLSQFLAKRDRPMEEKEILLMFQQMVSAVRYLHMSNILHRDLKTANIFLTKENSIKIGDFGISKIMSTLTKNVGANTVVGTPYYISPEMCESKPYNAASDIWALGCILYELATLQKTFDGSNVPAVVKKIVSGQYDQIKGNYSSEFKALIKDMLQKNPENRPTATDLFL